MEVVHDIETKNIVKNEHIISKLLILLIIVLNCHTLFSQKRDLKFKHITQKDGLSNSNQNCIIQDKNGFIWIGTNDGLNKFDGYTIKVFKHDPEDSSSIVSNIINELYIDKKERLWVGTECGISLYDNEKGGFINNFKFDKTPINYQRQVISGIACNKKGNVIISTYNAGYLYEYDEQKASFKYINPKAGFQPQIQTMLIDSDDKIWVGGEYGFFLYDRSSDKYKKIEIENTETKTPPFKYVKALCEDDKKIWIGTYGSDLFVLDKKTQKIEFKKINSEPAEMQINKIFKDSKNNIWISNNKGLKCYDPKLDVFHVYLHDDMDATSLSTSGTLGIFEDYQGNLWVGGNGGYLNVDFHRKQFKHYNQNKKNSISLTKNSVQSIYKDHLGRLWIGSFNGGVDLINPNANTLVHYEYNGADPGSIGDGTIFKILEDRSKEIWICTYRSGIQKFDTKRNRFITYKNNPKDPKTLAFNDVRDLVEDSLGNFWVVTHTKGIDYFDRSNNVFYHYSQTSNYENSLPGNWTYALLIDRKGQLWVGTSDGLGRLNKDRKTFKNYRNNPKNPNSLSDNFVGCIIEDKKGLLWIGTRWGLNKFDPESEKFTLFTHKDGLTNDIIKGLLEDNNGDIWISTNQGLSKLEVTTNKFTNYYTDDGLQADEFLLGSFYKSKNGELFFGGINGLNAFFPDSIKIDTIIPPVRLTSFKLFYKTVDLNDMNSPLKKDISVLKEIELDYSMSVFSFEFVALNYIQAERNQYACKMEGFDEKWIALGNRREVTYTNLNPGTYTFRVIASNNNDVWNKTGASIKITIKPPFWRTIWAFIIYFIVLLIVLYVFRQMILSKARIKNQMELEKIEWRNKMNLEKIEAEKQHEIDNLKLKFFTNISHEFRTPLTLIISPLENFLKFGFDSGKETSINQLRLMYKNALRLLRLINQILSIRKLESGTLKPKVIEDNIVLFIKDIAQSFHIHAIQRNLKFEIKSEKDEITAWFDPEMMDKIIYNLLSNAFKFTKTGSITMNVNSIEPENIALTNSQFYNPGCIEISVTDTGIGIPADKLSHIFERFYQIENTNSTSIAGSGIGLSLVTELIELHKGKITVESEVGKGSTFKIIFPLGKSLFSSDEISAEPRKYLGDMNNNVDLSQIEYETFQKDRQTDAYDKKVPLVLVVEDNADVRVYLGNELSSSYNIIDATNGLEGIEKALEEIPDIIISDVMMPVMNGFDLCERLKRDEKTSHIPIILLTARSGEDNVVQGLETGADDYISKPFSIIILKARIRNLLDNRKRLRDRYNKELDVEPSEIAINSLDKQFLERALKNVEDNISNIHYSPEEFIEKMNMSKTQLYRKLKSLTGQSVSIFIRTIRLKRAAQIMKQEKFHVSEVAFMVGFSDPAYFTKCFKEYFNESPTQFANKIH